jgi:hypothetical protein
VGNVLVKKFLNNAEKRNMTSISETPLSIQAFEVGAKCLTVSENDGAKMLN